MKLINYELTLLTNKINESSEKIEGYNKFLEDNKVLLKISGEGFYKIIFKASDSFSKKDLSRYLFEDSIMAFLRS